MTNDDDWRLAANHAYLAGLVWQWKPWTQTRPHWDHDHCEFCNAKFMDKDDAEVLREGYTDSEEYYWICKTCFEDFRDKYRWIERAAE